MAEKLPDVALLDAKIAEAEKKAQEELAEAEKAVEKLQEDLPTDNDEDKHELSGLNDKMKKTSWSCNYPCIVIDLVL